MPTALSHLPTRLPPHSHGKYTHCLPVKPHGSAAWLLGKARAGFAICLSNSKGFCRESLFLQEHLKSFTERFSLLLFLN